MSEVIGKVGPTIDLNEEVAEFDVGKACGDQIFKCFRTSGPVVCFQRRQNQIVVFDSDMTVFAS